MGGSRPDPCSVRIWWNKVGEGPPKIICGSHSWISVYLNGKKQTNRWNFRPNHHGVWRKHVWGHELSETYCMYLMLYYIAWLCYFMKRSVVQLQNKTFFLSSTHCVGSVLSRPPTASPTWKTKAVATVGDRDKGYDFRFILLDFCSPATLSSSWEYLLESRTSKWHIDAQQVHLCVAASTPTVFYLRYYPVLPKSKAQFFLGGIANSRGLSGLEINKAEWCAGGHISRQTYVFLFKWPLLRERWSAACVLLHDHMSHYI